MTNALKRRDITYLRLSSSPTGYIDQSGDWATADGLEKKKLVTVVERLVKLRGGGIAPVPHVTATKLGLKMLELLS